jgi:DNA-binding transcriptional LysR family regulator
MRQLFSDSPPGIACRVVDPAVVGAADRARSGDVPGGPELRRAYPDVTVEIDVNDASIDTIAEGFDAGTRIGDFIERDMVAVRIIARELVALRITPAFRWVVVGAPAYFAARGRPRTPKDLTRHECIRYRFPTARTVYRWQFLRKGREFSLDPPGGVIVNDHPSLVALAARGVGLAYTADLVAARELAAGRLEGVLAGYLPTKPGLFVYFPTRRQDQPKLRALIEVLTRLMRAA